MKAGNEQQKDNKKMLKEMMVENRKIKQRRKSCTKKNDESTFYKVMDTFNENESINKLGATHHIGAVSNYILIDSCPFTKVTKHRYMMQKSLQTSFWDTVATNIKNIIS